MTSLEELCRDAAAHPPAEPRLHRVEQRAARRSLTRNVILAMVFIAAPAGLWLASAGSDSDLLLAVPADESPGESVAPPTPSTPSTVVGGGEILSTSGLDALIDSIDLETVGGLEASAGSVILADRAFVERAAIPGLSLLRAPTADGRLMCLLLVTAVSTSGACDDLEYFEQSGMTVLFADPGDAGLAGTVITVPSGTLIGDLGEGISSPSGTFHVWPEGSAQPVARLVDGRLSVDLGPDAPPRELDIGSTIRFGPDCEVAVRVYNGSSRSGIAGRLSTAITDTIFGDDALAGGVLEPRNTVNYIANVTWIMHGELDCADLTLLGLPIPAVVESDSDAWARVDPQWVGDNRVAIVLGELYSEE